MGSVAGGKGTWMTSHHWLATPFTGTLKTIHLRLLPSDLDLLPLDQEHRPHSACIGDMSFLF